MPHVITQADIDYAIKTANDMCRRMYYRDNEEAESVAVCYLSELAVKYDDRRGATFKTFIYLALRHRLFRFINKEQKLQAFIKDHEVTTQIRHMRLHDSDDDIIEHYQCKNEDLFLLVNLHGLSIREAAAIYDEKEHTIRRKLKRARARILSRNLERKEE